MMLENYEAREMVCLIEKRLKTYKKVNYKLPSYLVLTTEQVNKILDQFKDKILVFREKNFPAQRLEIRYVYVFNNMVDWYSSDSNSVPMAERIIIKTEDVFYPLV